MSTTLGRCCCAIVVAMLLASTADAGPLATDAAAIPGWTGSTLFSGTNAGNTHTVTAIVDFAVYAPGDFSLSAALGNPTDVSGGTQYIYAYEVFREGLDANIASLTVSLIARRSRRQRDVGGPRFHDSRGGRARDQREFRTHVWAQRERSLEFHSGVFWN